MNMQQMQPQPLTPEEQQKLKECQTRIDALLLEYNCVLRPIITLSDTGVIQSAITVTVRRGGVQELNIPTPEPDIPE